MAYFSRFIVFLILVLLAGIGESAPISNLALSFNQATKSALPALDISLEQAAHSHSKLSRDQNNERIEELNTVSPSTTWFRKIAC